ncbi:hypothetical protein [Paenibacillus sp. URB8-2]|uniref:hypothetical protein n=1 Tax=Paenibacillus sp. URB8-2 TaxID=2741301 RepID=UPI0015B89501|nr:hypothetical protein [Paenibacillus sp. URB8-2]BCG56843.1 hypothetical protein PUR_02680 [Paenibacillus sp. URB8-2]
MPRKVMAVQGSGGRPIRVSIGVKQQERIVDPTGFLTHSSQRLTRTEHEVFQEWKRKVQSGEINIEYP